VFAVSSTKVREGFKMCSCWNFRGSYLTLNDRRQRRAAASTCCFLVRRNSGWRHHPSCPGGPITHTFGANARITCFGICPSRRSCLIRKAPSAWCFHSYNTPTNRNTLSTRKICGIPRLRISLRSFDCYRQASPDLPKPTLFASSTWYFLIR
jgi:hypothetical protein